MTERKYTDEEVIKALEHAMYSAKGEDGFKELHWEMLKDFLDLITRQKAELDICRTALKLISEELPEVKVIHHRNIQRAKAEAIRAFAERLKKKSYPFPCAIGVENAVTIRAINDLVKEMTES